MFRHPQSTPARNQYTTDYSMKAMPRAPDRPLVPYMRYSRKMWPKVRSENPDAQLWDIGKIIGQMWKDLSDVERSLFQHEYDCEKIEYEKQMKSYQNSPGYLQYTNSKSRAKANEKNSRSRMDAGGVVIQPIDEEDAVNELSARRLAAVRFDRNHRLVCDLFSPAIVTDTRTVVAQQRMEMLRRQASSLAQHQSKLEEELIKLETTHNERKRNIEKNSDEFQVSLKKVCDEKPVVDEKSFEEMVSKSEEKLLEAYAEYKRKEDEILAKSEAAEDEKSTESAPVLRNLVMSEEDDGAKSAAKSCEGTAPEEEPSSEEAGGLADNEAVTQ
ncbi:unnamed protein product [Caenorhabditis auriculariae]|uniref:HMG box domain-containing protein n=1 Tax=Caenorhabditis auriculariae TaxID=2777116 RepID=A0A8S1GXR1_9PELO|nr:unnamed protein product [Caenorhabditis auriculariae]